MIESDDRKDDSWRNQVAVWTANHSGHNGNDRNRLEDGEVKEMIIGVRNGQFTWAYGELNRSYPSPLAISVPMGDRLVQPAPALPSDSGQFR